MRNWDYRYCWLRDATFTLYALLIAGYTEEAQAWRRWLLRAVAGDRSEMQIMYGVAGERRLTEFEVPWLPGYEDSRRCASATPRMINSSSTSMARSWTRCTSRGRYGLRADEDAWNVQGVLLDFLETVWEKPDEGIWEVRGPRRHFTHSKVMAWVAFDRAVKAVEQHAG